MKDPITAEMEHSWGKKKKEKTLSTPGTDSVGLP